MEEKAKPTRWWYVAALLSEILIGALGYGFIKDDDPKMANRVLIVSIIPTIIVIILIALLVPALMAYRPWH